MERKKYMKDISSLDQVNIFWFPFFSVNIFPSDFSLCHFFIVFSDLYAITVIFST